MWGKKNGKTMAEATGFEQKDNANGTDHHRRFVSGLEGVVGGCDWGPAHLHLNEERV